MHVSDTYNYVSEKNNVVMSAVQICEDNSFIFFEFFQANLKSGPSIFLKCQN